MPRMALSVRDAKRLFEEPVSSGRREGASLAPAEGIALMRAFYDEARMDDVEALRCE